MSENVPTGTRLGVEDLRALEADLWDEVYEEAAARVIAARAEARAEIQNQRKRGTK